jgi:hypothetical protein
MSDYEFGFQHNALEEAKLLATRRKRMEDYDCKNTITMAGPADDVTAAMELVSTQTSLFSFDKVMPVPEEIKTFNPFNIRPSVLAKFKALDAYTYRSDEWATPREAINVERKVIDMTPKSSEELLAASKGQLYIEKVAAYTFDTCFAPPSGIYFKLSEEFPNILFHYTFDIECEDESTAGWALGLAGELKNQVQYPTSFTAMKLHLEPFHEKWLSLSEDNDNE